MNISVIEKDNIVIYQIKDFGTEYEKVMKDNHYTKVEDRYEKYFPLPFSNAEKTKTNFLRYAPIMFEETANSTPMRWEKSLCHYAAIAKKAGIDWWTAGRTALAIRGVELEVNDLDIIFFEKDIDLVNEAFSDNIVEPIISTNGRPRGDWVKYFGLAYSYCQTCFAVEPHNFEDVTEPVHFSRYAASHLETISWKGYDIKVPSVELHLKTYERWGRTHTVQKIKEYLRKKG